jgi:hypothetical protein
MLQLQVNRSDSLTVNAKTGHHAPSSGWWRPENDPLRVRYLQQGEIMPPLHGSQTVWTLVRNVPPSVRASSRSTYS